MFRVPFITSALVLALFACGKPDPVDDKAAGAAARLPTVNAPAPSATGEPRAATGPARPLPTPAATIPPALQGRWGLSPADCMPGSSDAKGLLVISPSELRFYESRAVPAPGVQADNDSLSGNFAFTGEGQAWEKYETFELHKDKLVRTERDPVASFTYVRCK